MTSASDDFRLIADNQGAIRVLALDHRDSFRAVVGERASDEQLIEVKADLVGATQDRASGVMLDPAYGLQRLVLASLPAGLGIIAPLEAQGYLADASVTHTTLMPGWNTARAAQVGAAAVKFLALWDGTVHSAQRDSIGAAVGDAHRNDLPLVLEPLPRGLDPFGPWVVEWVRAHVESGADMFKLPYPGSSSACADVTALAGRPWTMLSAGVGFETFLGQLEIAAAAGASGYIVGRAVWREAATVDPTTRARAIAEHVIPRLERLADVTFPAVDRW